MVLKAVNNLSGYKKTTPKQSMANDVWRNKYFIATIVFIKECAPSPGRI